MKIPVVYIALVGALVAGIVLAVFGLPLLYGDGGVQTIANVSAVANNSTSDIHYVYALKGEQNISKLLNKSNTLVSQAAFEKATNNDSYIVTAKGAVVYARQATAAIDPVLKNVSLIGNESELRVMWNKVTQDGVRASELAQQAESISAPLPKPTQTVVIEEKKENVSQGPAPAADTPKPVPSTDKKSAKDRLRKGIS